MTLAVNQMVTHPINQQSESQKLMEQYNVQIQLWAPLVMDENNVFQNETLVSIAKTYVALPINYHTCHVKQ